MEVKNILHLINIFFKFSHIKKSKNLKDILNINFENVDFKNLSKCKKTLFVSSHDYCFVDILSSWLISLKTELNKNTYTVVRESFISSFGIILPGAKMIEKGKNTTEKIIEKLKNNNNVLIFYSRIHLQYLNIQKIIKEVDIDIVPIRIMSDTIEPISHNIDGVLENIDIYLNNKFYVKILKKINYEKNYEKEYFIKILKEILYPDNGYFDNKGIFHKESKNYKIK